ncbi:MAG: ThuA domain-containing protein [Fibrobacteria bacterium]
MNARIGGFKAFVLGMTVLACDTTNSQAQAPVLVTKLKKILVLDKSQNGANAHLESRRDLNAALKELGAEKGFTVTTIGQNDAASKIASEFSATNLATYQAVLFSNNDGASAQLDATSKANLEAYVKAGGGFIPIHAASAYISNWPWLTGVLVRSFYGPHGDNMPKANVGHDAEGMKEGTETKGIYKGLTAPTAFLDEFYSFSTTPRGTAGVTVLLTVDEKTYSATVNGAMGIDHPVVWSKTDGKGRVVHMSMGHSWSTNNVFTAQSSYLKKYLYGTLRYVAGDFVGCTDNTFSEYNPDATKSDPAACRIPGASSILRPDGADMRPLVSREAGGQLVTVSIRSVGAHSVSMLDVSGRAIHSRNGVGPIAYSLPLPAHSGMYTVMARSGGKTTRYRVTVI